MPSSCSPLFFLFFSPFYFIFLFLSFTPPSPSHSLCSSLPSPLCPNLSPLSSHSRIPDRPTQCEDYNCNTDLEFGMHENYQYYLNCRLRERNMGLFTSDRNLNGNSAIYTRQNNNGQRRGYECPEERDYYPYWHPTPWRVSVTQSHMHLIMRNKTFISISISPSFFYLVLPSSLRYSPLFTIHLSSSPLPLSSPTLLSSPLLPLPFSPHILKHAGYCYSDEQCD